MRGEGLIVMKRIQVHGIVFRGLFQIQLFSASFDCIFPRPEYIFAAIRKHSGYLVVKPAI